MVRPDCCAISRSRAESVSSSVTRTDPEEEARWASRGLRSRGSSVGEVNPASAVRQCRSACVVSCSASQRR